MRVVQALGDHHRSGGQGVDISGSNLARSLAGPDETPHCAQAGPIRSPVDIANGLALTYPGQSCPPQELTAPEVPNKTFDESGQYVVERLGLEPGRVQMVADQLEEVLQGGGERVCQRVVLGGEVHIEGRLTAAGSLSNGRGGELSGALKLRSHRVD